MSKLLEEGDVIELKEGMKVYADIPEHFVYSNCRGSWKLTHYDITLDSKNFDYLLGKYIVVKTAEEGGGHCGNNDYYPNGHHVYCIKADKKSIKVDFYQTGSFTAMIEDIKPIKKAKLEWKL